MSNRTSNRFSSEDCLRVRVRTSLMAVSVSRSSPLKRPLPREALPVFSVLNSWAWHLTSPLRLATAECLRVWLSLVSSSPVPSPPPIRLLNIRPAMVRVSSAQDTKPLRLPPAIRLLGINPSFRLENSPPAIRQDRFRQGLKPVPWRLPEPLLLTCRLTNRRSLMSKGARLSVLLRHSVLR